MTSPTDPYQQGVTFPPPTREAYVEMMSTWQVKRIAELEAALRPFAEAWRRMEQGHQLADMVPSAHFARAAELIPAKEQN